MSKLLILYNEPYVQTLLSASLSKRGYRVVCVDKGGLIWEYIKNTQPDLVLLDAEKDGFDSLNLYFDIKQEYPYLPVVVYTATGQDTVDRINAAITEHLD
jgi:two-component system alkaline phosphatase synthesis response regulator PhoP